MRRNGTYDDSPPSPKRKRDEDDYDVTVFDYGHGRFGNDDSRDDWDRRESRETREYRNSRDREYSRDYVDDRHHREPLYGYRPPSPNAYLHYLAQFYPYHNQRPPTPGSGRHQHPPSDAYQYHSSNWRSRSPEYHQRYPEHDKEAVNYRSLYISKLPVQLSNGDIIQHLTTTFKRFSEFNIKIGLYNGERVAYINFRYSDDAKKAMYKYGQDLSICNKPVSVRPVIRGPNNPAHSPVQSTERRSRDERDPGASSMGSGGGSSHKNFFPQTASLAPEDDDLATRILFVGNLANDITSTDLVAAFEPYGTIANILIKPSVGGRFSRPYAFVTFHTLDMAYEAKTAMSGRPIKDFPCKIGYGRKYQTSCLWVGAIGPWITPENLESDFARFGSIEKVRWPPEKSYAYILYRDQKSAVEAHNRMRGFPLGGPEKRIRVDYVTEHEATEDLAKFDPAKTVPPQLRTSPDSRASSRSASPGGSSTRSTTRGHSVPKFPSKKSPSRKSSVNHGSSDDDDDHFVWTDEEKEAPRAPLSDEVKEEERQMTISTAVSPVDLARCLPSSWQFQLECFSRLFSTQVHFYKGKTSVLDQLIRMMKAGNVDQLPISQFVEITSTQLDSMKQIVRSNGPVDFAVLLSLPSPTAPQEKSVEEGETDANSTRPLKKLINYLRSRRLVGVICQDGPGETEEAPKLTAVVYVFPPCDFAHNILAQRAHFLEKDPYREDHLVVVIILGPSPD